VIHARAPIPLLVSESPGGRGRISSPHGTAAPRVVAGWLADRLHARQRSARWPVPDGRFLVFADAAGHLETISKTAARILTNGIATDANPA
jgi:hypothetical protein